MKRTQQSFILTSIRSCSGAGMRSNSLAVAMNNTEVNMTTASKRREEEEEKEEEGNEPKTHRDQRSHTQGEKNKPLDRSNGQLR